MLFSIGSFTTNYFANIMLFSAVKKMCSFCLKKLSVTGIEQLNYTW